MANRINFNGAHSLDNRFDRNAGVLGRIDRKRLLE